MKTMFNLTTDPEDMRRFRDSSDLLALMDGFDGVELLCFEPAPEGIIPPGRVIGLHMCFFPYWLDLYNMDKPALFREFGPETECRKYYSGSSPDALFRRFRSDIENAKGYGAEYVVFHVSDASIEESFTRAYRHKDAEVIDAACEILNALFADEDGTLILLLENLWQPGLTFTDPEMTKRLLDGIDYPNKGIMLDTGHLLHTNTKLRTHEEGLMYIHEMLDRHEGLADAVRGVHLHQSLTGVYSERMMALPPPKDAPYAERNMQAFFHACAVDKHEPFTCPGVRGLIERISPEYLTYEFFSKDAQDLRAKLAIQKMAFCDSPKAAP